MSFWCVCLFYQGHIQWLHILSLIVIVRICKWCNLKLVCNQGVLALINGPEINLIFLSLYFTFAPSAVRPRCIQMTCLTPASSSCFTTRHGAPCCERFTVSSTALPDTCWWRSCWSTMPVSEVGNCCRTKKNFTYCRCLMCFLKETGLTLWLWNHDVNFLHKYADDQRCTTRLNQDQYITKLDSHTRSD